MSRILIVDDNASIRLMLTRGLASEGHEVDDARDGVEAVRRLDERQYEVVVTDLRMEGSDGLDVLRKCLLTDPAPAVILMSGHGTIDVAVEAIKLGAFDFVQKPFGIEQMRLRIGRALDFRRLKNQVSIDGLPAFDYDPDPASITGPGEASVSEGTAPLQSAR